MTTEKHTEQVSKREVAIGNIEAYMTGWLTAFWSGLEETWPGMTFHFTLTDEVRKSLRQTATDVYRIVKRAEGFDV